MGFSEKNKILLLAKRSIKLIASTIFFDKYISFSCIPKVETKEKMGKNAKFVVAYIYRIHWGKRNLK